MGNAIESCETHKDDQFQHSSIITISTGAVKLITGKTLSHKFR